MVMPHFPCLQKMRNHLPPSFATIIWEDSKILARYALVQRDRTLPFHTPTLIKALHNYS